MIRPLLSALLCLSLGACSTSVKNPAQAARVDKIRLGAVTAEAPDAKGIEKEFKRARLKRGMAESLLMVSGVAVAGAIGGQGGVNNYIIQSNWDRASAPPVAPGTGIDDLTAGEVALKNRILQLAATQQSTALGRALKDYAPTGKRVSGSGAYRLDCRITFAGHDRRKKSQYLWLEGKATLTGPDGAVVWESSAYGDSDTGYGGPAAAPAATKEQFLTPAALNDHFRAATAYLAQSVAEGLAGDLGWEE